jgi:hypothetical protein
VIGSVTVFQQQMAGLEKRRKKHREREAAAIAADLAREHGMSLQAEREQAEAERAAAAGCEPAEKAMADLGIHEGPGQPVTPGEIFPQDALRPYLAAGHAADAPGNPGPGMRHADLTRSRGTLTRVNPSAPMGPGGSR